MVPITLATWPEKWEYKVAEPRTRPLSEWELSRLGKEGWLLIATFTYPGLGGTTYFDQIFVRPKPEADEGGGE